MAKQQKKGSATRSKGSTRRVSKKSTKASSRKARVGRSDRKKTATKQKAAAKKVTSRRKASPQRKAAVGGGRAKPRQVVIPGSSESAEWLAAAADLRQAFAEFITKQASILAGGEIVDGFPRSVAIKLIKLKHHDAISTTLSQYGFGPREQYENPYQILERVNLIGPEQIREAFERESLAVPPDLFLQDVDLLWVRAVSMWKPEHHMPALPQRPAALVDALVVLRQWCVLCIVSRTYRIARQFVSECGTISLNARRMTDCKWDIETAKKLSPLIASATVSVHNLQWAMIPEVRTLAMSLYTPASPPPRFGSIPPTHSVIEAVSHHLGSRLRKVVFRDRRSPLDPDIGQATAKSKAISTDGYQIVADDVREVEQYLSIQRTGINSVQEAKRIFEAEIQRLDSNDLRFIFESMKIRDVNFDELVVRLDVEAKAAVDNCKLELPHDERRNRTDELKLLRLRPGTWFEQACDFIYGKDGVGIVASDLRNAHIKYDLDAHRLEGKRELQYVIRDVVEHQWFDAHKDAILRAVGVDFGGRPRKKRRPKS